MLNKLFTPDNIKELIEAIVNKKVNVPEWQRKEWNRLKDELQVHTQGHFFMKSIDLYRQEPADGKEYAIRSYEPITKSSINRGLIDLSRVFLSTATNISLPVNRIDQAKKTIQEYVEKFVDVAQALDPNTVAVAVDGQIKYVQSGDILAIDKDFVLFIDRDNSDFEMIESPRQYFSAKADDKKVISFVKFYEPQYNGKKTYILSNKFQTVTLTKEKGSKDFDVTFNVKNSSDIKPYVALGVKIIGENVRESAVHNFIPFGNMCLLHHKTHRQIEALFGYPRMTEIETPCNNPDCYNGKVICKDPAKLELAGNPQILYESCDSCNGTGSISLQSLWRIYKRKVESTRPANETGLEVPSVQFHLPPVEALERTNDMWKELLELAEKAIFIRDKKETGNTESASAKEKDLQDKYNALQKVAEVYYSGLETLLSALFESVVTIERPVSMAVMGETEAFELLEKISASKAPVFIKNAHLENFLKRYVSASNPVIKAVELLKKIDLFLFYSNEELQQLSDMGVLSAEDKIIHYYAYPILMQLFYNNPDIFNLAGTEKLLNEKIEVKKTEILSPADSSIRRALLNNGDETGTEDATEDGTDNS